MSSNATEGNWNQFKRQVREQWGKPADAPLDMIVCQRAPPVGRRQETHGISRDQAELQLKAFAKLYEDSPPESLRVAAPTTMRA